MPNAPSPSVAELRRALSELTVADGHRLGRELERARTRAAGGRGAGGNPGGDAHSNADGGAGGPDLTALAARVQTARESVERRRGSVPAVSYPPELPITARVDDLKATIDEHQVVVVAGETGSGKTTQLPKICLELGRGVRGAIGHTQPRRLAARTVAERIASELAVPLGGPVGYDVRFSQRSSPDTLVRLMTDGILLATVQSDPLLRAYDTIIIDEAHERSLNIDFLVGYLARLLPRRPDLKVIITSATIDPHRFAHHFDDAPVVEVSGRTYPVEVRYRPLAGPASGPADVHPARGTGRPEDPDDADDTDDWAERDQPQAICDAVRELFAEGPGDVLVFCSGEREIRDATDALTELDLRDTEILPLYARLSPAQQNKVFRPHRSRRVVLATNVAETSLTVPGIRYVVDTGLARISRYSSRLKVQRLPIEKVSRASADQRKGRCGRTADGICVRLYSEDDFLARPEFTDPEILRTNLASVLLQMAHLDLGDIADFPFLDPPDARQVRDGLQLLTELGALVDAGAADGRKGRRRRGRGRRSGGPQLTRDGRTLARLPIDPRIGRMVIEGHRRGCLDEVLVVAAALSIPDPRLRPSDDRRTADTFHERFADPASDFVAFLNLWRYLRDEQRARSSNQFRKMCRAEYLHYLRVREWQDLYSQLRRVARELGMKRTDTPGEADQIHRALLAGLLSHVGLRDGEARDYAGARGARFAVWPGSALSGAPPQYVMAAELVETSRLWARTAARVDPSWVEQAAGPLVTRTYREPHWEERRGGTVAYERVSLYGVTLVASRKVDYGRIDPELAREELIRHALVGGEWSTDHGFVARNARRLAEVERLEDKLRRRDVVVDADALFAFYDARVPAHVVSTRHFDRWWRDAGKEQPDLLDLTDELLTDRHRPADAYPDRWRQGDLDLHLSYTFDPGADDDGMTVHVPVGVLGRLRPDGFDWHAPGYREDRVVALLRGLPKPLRRQLVPVPDTARAILAARGPGDGPLLRVLDDELARRGVRVPVGTWEAVELPPHLEVRFRVERPDGSVVAAGRDLADLQRRLAPQVRSALGAAAGGIERSGLTVWPDGLPQLPRTVPLPAHGPDVTGYPALTDEGASVGVKVYATSTDQARAMWGGTRRLLLLATANPVSAVHRRLDNATKLALTGNPHGGVDALVADATAAAVDRVLADRGGPVWTADAFAALQRTVRGELPEVLAGVLRRVAEILTLDGELRRRLDAATGDAYAGAVADLRRQRAGLVHDGFVTAKTTRRLPDLVRYLEGMLRRLDTLARDPARDRRRMERVAEVQTAFRDVLTNLPPAARAQPAVREIPWLIEELRVSEFAQSLGTAGRVSPERILRAVDDLRG